MPSAFPHNIVDPFEDTERSASRGYRPATCHNIVDPFEDTESGVQFARMVTTHDPFEDTESRRSVRGY